MLLLFYFDFIHCKFQSHGNQLVPASVCLYGELVVVVNNRLVNTNAEYDRLCALGDF
ncbi:MAG: hypothetical protein MR567_03115 [Oscillospiraceae bacterium]|nr:hypothetical protein [Oscillospiraceae bacterium]